MVERFFILIKYAFLGIVQGFTEPIPISSSGHLVIIEHLMGIHIKGLSFELLMNTASLLAVLVIYRQDLIRLTSHSFQYAFLNRRSYRRDYLFIVYLIIGTLPAGLIGVLFKDAIESHLKSISIVGGMLILTGIGLWIIRHLKGRKSDHDLSIKDALIVGFAQSIALIPGISRSGATIIAAMGTGMRQETALRYSFLLYIPVSLGGIVLSLQDLIHDPNIKELFIPYVISFFLSFIASYYALRWFMGIMIRGNLKYFAYYCILLGVIILLFI